VPFDGAFSPIHWVIIGVVALMVLGPERLPDAARGLGRAMHAFEKAKSSIMEEIRGALEPGPDDQAQSDAGGTDFPCDQAASAVGEASPTGAESGVGR
jgi:sec-independent protein translocase protein TatA